MDTNEYSNLARLERQHWFYVGKRDIVRHWIQRVHALSPDHWLVDCGAGTGTFAAEMASRCKVLAVDDHEEALALARDKLGDDRVKHGTCVGLPLLSNSVDVLTALDVIEHVEQDRQALLEFSRVVRPGGVVILTVPALMLLWSDWDVALHHFRRYTRRSLLALIPQDSLTVVHCAYVNVAAFPLVLLARKWRALQGRAGHRTTWRLEDSVPPRWVNRLLHWSFVRLGCQSLVRFPVGVGLLAVLRKK